MLQRRVMMISLCKIRDQGKLSPREETIITTMAIIEAATTTTIIEEAEEEEEEEAEAGVMDVVVEEEGVPKNQVECRRDERSLSIRK
jgi:hypothetical protein